MKAVAVPVLLVVFALAASMAIVSCLGIIAGCSPAAVQQQVDVVDYSTEEMACVMKERADLVKCHADRPACRARIDACRAEVRGRLLDGGAP